MTLIARLTALEHAPSAMPIGCADAFHRRFDYREAIRELAPVGAILPPAPLCPTCGGVRFPAAIGVRVTRASYEPD